LSSWTISSNSDGLKFTGRWFENQSEPPNLLKIANFIAKAKTPSPTSSPSISRKNDIREENEDRKENFDDEDALPKRSKHSRSPVNDDEDAGIFSKKFL